MFDSFTIFSTFSSSNVADSCSNFISSVMRSSPPLTSDTSLLDVFIDEFISRCLAVAQVIYFVLALHVEQDLWCIRGEQLIECEVVHRKYRTVILRACSADKKVD